MKLIEKLLVVIEDSRHVAAWKLKYGYEDVAEYCSALMSDRDWQGLRHFRATFLAFGSHP